MQDNTKNSEKFDGFLCFFCGEPVLCEKAKNEVACHNCKQEFLRISGRSFGLKIADKICCKLTGEQTKVFVDGKDAVHCSHIPVDLKYGEDCKSMDAILKNGESHGMNFKGSELLLATKSNLQFWIEQEYNPILIDSRIARSLLPKIAEIDPIAWAVCEQAVLDRWAEGNEYNRKAIVSSEMAKKMLIDYAINQRDYYMQAEIAEASIDDDPVQFAEIIIVKELVESNNQAIQALDTKIFNRNKAILFGKNGYFRAYILIDPSVRQMIVEKVCDLWNKSDQKHRIMIFRDNLGLACIFADILKYRKNSSVYQSFTALNDALYSNNWKNLVIAFERACDSPDFFPHKIFEAMLEDGIRFFNKSKDVRDQVNILTLEEWAREFQLDLGELKRMCKHFNRIYDVREKNHPRIKKNGWLIASKEYRDFLGLQECWNPSNFTQYYHDKEDRVFVRRIGKKWSLQKETKRIN